MKTQERVYPDLVQETRETAGPRRAGDAAGGGDEVEIDADWIDPVESEEITAPSAQGLGERFGAGAGVPVAAAPTKSGRRSVPTHLKTAEVNIERDRRTTLTSPIPAIMAESMRQDATRERDPAAPEPEHAELTRRLGDSDRHLESDTSAGYTVEVVDDGNAERRQRAARLLDRARARMDAGDAAAAAADAEDALEEADAAAPPGIVEVIEPARPLVTRIFAAFVGPLGEVPVLARPREEIAGLPLDDRRRAVVARVDGRHTLDQILDGARIPASDALRVAASLIRAGIIRMV
jgi:hypothetical protein